MHNFFYSMVLISYLIKDNSHSDHQNEFLCSTHTPWGWFSAWHSAITVDHLERTVRISCVLCDSRRECVHLQGREGNTLKSTVLGTENSAKSKQNSAGLPQSGKWKRPFQGGGKQGWAPHTVSPPHTLPSCSPLRTPLVGRVQSTGTIAKMKGNKQLVPS